MKNYTTSLFLLLVAACATIAFAAPPRTISYQGYLKNNDGTPVNTGTNVRFSFYSSSLPRNNPVWRESQSVTPTNGIYSVQLGAVTPVTAPFDVPYWLGVQVGSDSEMAPQPLDSVPYALRAATANSAASAGTAATVADGAVTTATIVDKAITAAKIGVPCKDGEVLKYNGQQNAWVCDPATGGFTAAVPAVGVLAVAGITASGPSSPTAPDPYKDLMVYGFDVSFLNPTIDSGTTVITGKVSLGLKVVCDPRQNAATLNLLMLKGSQVANIDLWIPGPDGRYGKFISLKNVYITSQKPVPPARPGDKTLVEYTLSTAALTVADPFAASQSFTIDFSKNSTTGSCTHNTALAFSVTHGTVTGMSDLGSPIYPMTSYETSASMTISSSGGGSTGKAQFSDVVITGPLGKDAPCLLKDISGSSYSESLVIYTTGAENSEKTRVLESRLRLADHVFLTSFGFTVAPSGTIQQYAGYTARKIYWGYYPYDPKSGQNGTLVESGWDKILNAQL